MNGRMKCAHRTLIVSYAFPPVNVVGAIRPFFLCKYLSKDGWRADVLARNVWKGASIDESLTLPKNLPTTVHRCKDLWDYSFFSNNRIFGWLLRPFFVPDEFVFWNVSAFKKTLALIKKYNFDVVVCTVPPVSSLIGPLLAAKMMKTPFIADFRDLWTLHEYKKLKEKNKLKYRIEELLEKFVIRCADRVILNTDIALDLMKKKYKIYKSKMTAITNGVDYENIEIKKGKQRRFSILHAGSFYLDRNPNLFFECVSEWLRSDPKVKDNIEIIMAGKNNDTCEEKIKELHLEGIVQLHGQVGKNQVFEFIANAHVLLIFLGYQKESNYVVPAKLYEYMAFKKPILAFVPNEGAAHQVIHDLKLGKTIENGAKEKVVEALQSFYTDYLDGSLGHEYFKFPEKFKYSNISNQFAKEMSRVIHTSHQ